MKNLEYQQRAVTELIDKTIRLLNAGGQRNKMVFEATTGAGKTVMACLMLAGLMDELHDRGDSRYQEVAFIWFAPRKLHIQSYEKLKEAFEETRTLRPVMFDELDQNEGIRPGEILFVNWESVNKESNVMVREGDCSLSLYEITDKTKDEFGLPIVAIIDEEHMFWSKTADKSSAVLDRINPAVEIRISATPKTANPKEKVTVYRQDVIAAEMIKKEVVLNPEIELNFSDELELNANLIKAALDKRNQIAEAYKAVGTRINPLLLIQLPNDTKENMTAEDTAIADQVKKYLEVMCGITTDNHRLAIWLANEKENLTDLEKPDNLTEVLLFKEAIALGWDCPRAAVLLIFRKLQSDQFTIQTVGRIMRMPEQKHYPKEMLNVGYVFTDIAKDKIQIVTADADYILNNTVTAYRRENLKNVWLPACYSERPNIERNYLGPDFRKVLYDEARHFWDFAEGPLAGSLNDAFRRMGYWFHYGTFIRSYKLKALSFFKAFKTCLEVSNPRYTFNTRNLDAMKGKRIGIVLGEEEYRKEDGTVGTRLYVATVRSVKAIQDGDFKVPALKKLGSPNQPAPPAPAPQRGYGSAQPAPSGYGYSQPYGSGFVPLPDESDIPF